MLEDSGCLTHDQIVARVQAFYNLLRSQHDERKVIHLQNYDEDEQKAILRRYEDASELLDLFSHTFEEIIYTWLE